MFCPCWDSNAKSYDPYLLLLIIIIIIIIILITSMHGIYNYIPETNHVSRRGESPMVPGPDCVEDGRMCPNGIHHAARSVSAWQYVGVHCHGSEQCHVRICLCGGSE